MEKNIASELATIFETTHARRTPSEAAAQRIFSPEETLTESELALVGGGTFAPTFF